MNTVLFFIGAVLLYGAWGTLVLLGKADAHEYVLAIGAGLSWLATHVAAKKSTASVSPIEGVSMPAVEFAPANGVPASTQPATAATPASTLSAAAPAMVQ